MPQPLTPLLDALETTLRKGGDPTPLVRHLRVAGLEGWPTDRASAMALRRRLATLGALARGLEQPLRATLLCVRGNAPYGPDGGSSAF